MEKKDHFAPLPTRAIADTRLTGTDLRALAAICQHDRFGRKRGSPGCYAARDRLAALCGVNASNLSSAISKLERLGYIVRERRQGNGRQFAYYVIYSDEDHETWDRLPRGNRTPADQLPIDKSIGCSGESQEAESIEELDIKREDKRFCETGINTRERAPSGGDVTNIGALLAQFEREFKAGEIETEELERYEASLSKIHEDGIYEDAVTQWAGRLADEVGYELFRREGAE